MKKLKLKCGCRIGGTFYPGKKLVEMSDEDAAVAVKLGIVDEGEDEESTDSDNTGTESDGDEKSAAPPDNKNLGSAPENK